MTTALPTIARRLREVGRDFYLRGWVLGTSGNFSVVIARHPLKLVITASSISKGAIGVSDVLTVDAAGTAIGKPKGRPSAETLLHVAIAELRGAGAILHTHSIWSTLLSDLHAHAGALSLGGFEMLKGLEGVRTHEHRERVPIFENDQDMRRLAGRVRAMLETSPDVHGFLLRGHGLYTWGADLAQARRHIEIFEFLLELTGRQRELNRFKEGDKPWP